MLPSETLALEHSAATRMSHRCILTTIDNTIRRDHREVGPIVCWSYLKLMLTRLHHNNLALLRRHMNILHLYLLLKDFRKILLARDQFHAQPLPMRAKQTL